MTELERSIVEETRAIRLQVEATRLRVERFHQDIALVVEMRLDPDAFEMSMFAEPPCDEFGSPGAGDEQRRHKGGVVRMKTLKELLKGFSSRSGTAAQLEALLEQEAAADRETQRRTALADLAAAEAAWLSKRPALRDDIQEAIEAVQKAEAALLERQAAHRALVQASLTGRHEFDVISNRLQAVLNATAPVAIGEFLNELEIEIERVRQEGPAGAPLGNVGAGVTAYEVNQSGVTEVLAALRHAREETRRLAVRVFSDADAAGAIEVLRASIPYAKLKEFTRVEIGPPEIIGKMSRRRTAA